MKIPITNNISAIYKIFCKDNNIIDIYIGKTRNFKKRKHKTINNNETKEVDHEKSIFNFSCL